MGKREEKSKRQRRAIISAAVGVFSRKGFHRARVEEIARRAGVGKGTIYIYFEDKSQLFAAAVAEGIESIMAQLAAELESDLPFLEHLERLAAKNVSLYLQYGDLTKIFHNELSNGINPKARRQIERVRSRYLDFIAQTLRDGHRRGYLRRTDFKLSAVAILGLLDALCDYQLRNRDAVDKKSVKDVVFMLLASGLIERDRRPRAAR